MTKVRITMTVDVDSDMLCDEDTLLSEYGGDWLRFCQEMAIDEGVHFFTINWPEATRITCAERTKIDSSV